MFEFLICYLYSAFITDQKQFHCTLCKSASFTRIQRLNKHIREKHPGGKRVDINTYKPPPWPYTPKPKHAKPVTIESYTPPSPGTDTQKPCCVVCGKTFLNYKGLNGHMAVHQGTNHFFFICFLE